MINEMFLYPESLIRWVQALVATLGFASTHLILKRTFVDILKDKMQEYYDKWDELRWPWKILCYWLNVGRNYEGFMRLLPIKKISKSGAPIFHDHDVVRAYLYLISAFIIGLCLISTNFTMIIISCSVFVISFVCLHVDLHRNPENS